MVDKEIKEKVKQIANEIASRKIKLKETDYQAIKFAEGELTAEEYAETKEKRKQWRAEINELEAQLKALKKE